uniref:Uncharacterized protein n=1 Tax=Siphoviridae sp. ctrgt10 TaxID=2826479 RepID=A0A8S5M7V1_9CAUD|nr:MAG TPA: hypothetical protein [Siphoviridae sp. ctrgt10]
MKYTAFYFKSSLVNKVIKNTTKLHITSYVTVVLA